MDTAIQKLPICTYRGRIRKRKRKGRPQNSWMQGVITRMKEREIGDLE